MKKLFAILLVLTMLIPMGMVAQAEKVEKKPFALVNWSAPNEDYTNVFYMPYYWSNSAEIKNGNANAYAPAFGASSIPDLVDETKDFLDKLPEGARHINFTMVATAVHALADICFVEKVPPLVSGWLEEFLKQYKAAGGKLDGLVIDVEFLNIYGHYIEGDFFSKDPLVYDKIVKNPAYAEKIRPKLVERGFKFYSPVNEHTPEIYGIHPKSGSEYALSRGIWDTVMQNYLADAITESCAPLWKYYPDATVSDYTVKDVKPWVKEVSEGGGVLGGGGNRETAGNASNENFYSVRPGTNFFSNKNVPVYNTLPGRVETVFANTHFNRFMFEANLGKTTYLSADNGKVTWWLAHAYYGEKNARTPFYAETVFHLGLLNPEIFYGYILLQDCKTDGAQDPEKYDNALKIVDDCLRQLSDVAGYADRKVLNVEPSWNHDFVLSGMYAGGRNIYRITPDNNEVTLEEFLVKDAADPTFKVNGETVTFPKGKIIKDSEVFDIGTYGYWVETPADVNPIITRVDNYFRNYASYQETFEGFEAGTEYNYDNAKPAGCWENKKQGTGSAVVVVDPSNANNKVVEVKGNYTMKNINMPKNVRAGDTYAENQAWEITITLPSDLAADDEMVLLNVVPEKKKVTDGGFKIAGDKIYYDDKGEYVAFEGVTLTGGSKYTLVRDMNFNVADAYTSDYYIYSADGTLVAKAKKVPTAAIEIPVYGVSMIVKNPSGAAVLLDDYKLYPTKVATDFYLYHANSGMKVEDTEKAQQGNIAYRLSWLNSTQTEKSYTIMAAYYDGDTLVSEEVVKEIKMAPNGDNVAIGVVENKQEGKTMRVYLKDNNPAEEEDDATTGGDNTKDPADDGAKLDPIIIIIAAAAVVAIAVVVIVIVAVSKKKKKAKAIEAAPEAVAEAAPVAEEPAPTTEEPKEE